jgi:two-component system phosphate regulon response regulator PhoB
VSDLVMVIEDEKEIRDLVRYNLEKAGFRVAAAADGEEGLKQLFAARPDALVLDLMLPGLNGLEIVREVRAEPLTHDLPVLVLTARSAEMDKLLGFEQGADDYLTKPFTFAELTARLRALIRRSHRVTTSVVKVGDLVVDTAGRRVSRGGRTIALRAKEYAILELLVLRRGNVVRREEILEHVYGHDSESFSNVIDVHLCRLRSALDLGTGTPLIRTVRGQGYAVVEP